MKRFRLREQAGADPQTYALGLKEVWEVSWFPCSSHCILAQSHKRRCVSGSKLECFCLRLAAPFATFHALG